MTPAYPLKLVRGLAGFGSYSSLSNTTAFQAPVPQSPENERWQSCVAYASPLWLYHDTMKCTDLCTFLITAYKSFKFSGDKTSLPHLSLPQYLAKDVKVGTLCVSADLRWSVSFFLAPSFSQCLIIKGRSLPALQSLCTEGSHIFQAIIRIPRIFFPAANELFTY